MKRKITLISLLLAFTITPVFAQLGSGIVYDPTNYHNAVLRYLQLQKQLQQLQQSYTYLKLALLAMAVVSAGLIYANVRTVRMVENFKPLVIRINDIGRAEAVKYDTLGYKPQDAEIKYFLSDFCRLYYSRNRYTVRDNFKKSLLFMEAQLANSVAEAYRKNHTIDDYLQNSTSRP